MTASSEARVPTGTRPPCVLVLLGFRRPCTNELTDGTTRHRPPPSSVPRCGPRLGGPQRGERGANLVGEVPVHRRLDDGERLSQPFLGVIRPALSSPHDAERVQRR